MQPTSVNWQANLRTNFRIYRRVCATHSLSCYVDGALTFFVFRPIGAILRYNIEKERYCNRTIQRSSNRLYAVVE